MSSQCRFTELLFLALQTTIMAASFPGGVVLGADTRTSTGSYVANRVTNKLTQLADKVPLPAAEYQYLPVVFLSQRMLQYACM